MGRWGEEQAALFLKNKGYELLGVGFSTRFGEIDIIAQKDGYVAFVEVKLRKNDRYGAAREFVTQNKQEKLRLTAQVFLQENEDLRLQPRFDVIEIYAPHGISDFYHLHHIENAFE